MSARTFVALLAVSLAVLGCEATTFVGSPGIVAPPANLRYALDPSGDPDRPAGILLLWDDVPDPELAGYRIYSRGSTGGSYGLRGETSSNTFHDNGVPHLQYFVVTVDANGDESDPSGVVTVDERLQLERPASLTSISLNGAIHLAWSDNAFAADPQRFQWYRLYSAAYDLDLGLCGADWSLEGTTVAPEFLAGALANGVPRCYGVSAISGEGYESLWSPLRQDTPRPDSRNVLVYAFDANPTLAGFRFWDDVNQDGVAQPTELGLVQDGSRTDIDFWVYRDPADSTLWIVPEFSGTTLRLYASTPIGDLTDIDFAPAGGYSRNMIQAAPGFGYVFQIIEGSTLRYGALRVTHVGRDYVIFDWSMQTDPGNPELVIRGNLPTSLETGIEVPGAT
jgi:hypothetical protein